MVRNCFAPGLAVVLVLALAAPCARADVPPPLTEEQSTSLGRSLRLWTAGLVGDRSAFTATPAEGGYDLAIPVAGPLGSSHIVVEGGPITAKASPAADGTWHFDAIALPSPLRISGPGMKDASAADNKPDEPGTDNPDTDNPGATKPDPAPTPWHVTQTFAGQSGTAVVNPTLGGPSSAEYERTGAVMRIEDSKTPLSLTTAKSATHIEWMPASAGRVDAGSVTRMEDIAAGSGQPDDSNGVTIHTVTITTQSADADPDRTSELVRQALAFASSLSPNNRDPNLTPAQRAALHDLVKLTHGLARSMTQSTSVEGIVVTSGHRQFSLDRLSLKQATAAPDGKLDTRLRLELSGLHLPPLLPGAAGDLVPRHLVIAPFVTGTPVEDVYAILDQTIDEMQDVKALAGQAQAGLMKAPVTTGIDELAFDLGPASVSGKGQMTTSGPGAVDATGVVEATGVDALIRKASSDPLLKRAAPVLIFLKGIGEQNGDRVVWKLAYAGGKFTVNGADMSALMPHK